MPDAAPVRVAGIEYKWWVLVAIGASTFMSALDISVINTVLPVITRDFNTQVATVEWAVIIYLLLVSGLLPVFGRLGDLYGHKPVFITGFLLFIFSSVLCGLSPSVAALIAARGLQALGAAMLSANSPAILTKSFPAQQRGQALGLQATMTYLGLTVGPILGGWLTDLFGWRTVFFINVPVGLLALGLSMRFIHRDRPSGSVERFDWPGALVFMAGLVALLLGLNQGSNWGWTSPKIVGLLAAASILLGVFIYIERRSTSPMLDLSLFKRRIFSTSIGAAVLNYICVFSITFLMPFYLIEGRGFSPSYTGLLLSAQPLVMAVAAPISGTISDRIGARLPCSLGMLILAAGLFWMYQLPANASAQEIVLLLAITGLGIGIFISPNNSALMGAAPRARQGIAAGLLATARNVGMVLGIGLSGAIFTTVIAHSASDIVQPIFSAVSAGFLAVSGVALLGLLVSLIRGNG